MVYGRYVCLVVVPLTHARLSCCCFHQLAFCGIVMMFVCIGRKPLVDGFEFYLLLFEKRNCFLPVSPLVSFVSSTKVLWQSSKQSKHWDLRGIRHQCVCMHACMHDWNEPSHSQSMVYMVRYSPKTVGTMYRVYFSICTCGRGRY